MSKNTKKGKKDIYSGKKDSQLKLVSSYLVSLKPNKKGISNIKLRYSIILIGFLFFELILVNIRGGLQDIGNFLIQFGISLEIIGIVLAVIFISMFRSVINCNYNENQYLHENLYYNASISIILIGAFETLVILLIFNFLVPELIIFYDYPWLYYIIHATGIILSIKFALSIHFKIKKIS